MYTIKINLADNKKCEIKTADDVVAMHIAEMLNNKVKGINNGFIFWALNQIDSFEMYNDLFKPYYANDHLQILTIKKEDINE